MPIRVPEFELLPVSHVPHPSSFIIPAVGDSSLGMTALQTVQNWTFSMKVKPDLESLIVRERNFMRRLR